MVEPYLLPANSNSTSVQRLHPWHIEPIFAKTEKNYNTNHQSVDSDSDDDDVQFVSEIRPASSHPAQTVDLSKSIFELLNDGFDEIPLNGISTSTNTAALDNNNAGHSLSNHHTHRTITTGQGEHDANIALANPFSQTLPQITVANFAKEKVLDISSNSNGASNSIFRDLDWLKDTNLYNHRVTEQLPKTTSTATAPASSTKTENDLNWADIFGVTKLPNQTLTPTNNPQPGPSASIFDFNLPYAYTTDSNVPAPNATNNIPNIDHQIHNYALPTPLPLTEQNQPGSKSTSTEAALASSTKTENDWNWEDIFGGMKLPNQTLTATSNSQPGPSTSILDFNLPYADTINGNPTAQIAANNNQNIDHQIHNSFALPTPLPFIPQQNQPGTSRLAYQPRQQVGISEPPPTQLANLPTPLPFIPQQNQPGPSRLFQAELKEPVQYSQNVSIPPQPPKVPLVRFIPRSGPCKVDFEVRERVHYPQHVSMPYQPPKLLAPLPFVPQQNQPRQQILEYVPAPHQQTKLPKPLPFVPQQNRPGQSGLVNQADDNVFRPYATNGEHPAEITPFGGNTKRKHTHLIPIKVVRNTKQYETLVEMGFQKKDIETALRKFHLDLYETIEYLSDPKRAAKRRKKDDNTQRQFNTELPNQLEQTFEEPKEVKEVKPIRKPANLYEELLYLEETGGIVKSVESFDCEICMETIEMKDGMILRNCLHRYCKDCLNGTIVHSEDIEIKCPYVNCEETLQDREIRAVLSKDEYEKYLMKCVRVAQVTISGTILCNLPDCNGWCICEDIVNEFKCPQCKNINCIPCKAIHPGRNCREYQDDLAAGDANGIISGERRSEQAIQELINKNEAMKCFKCGILIMKRDGCDYIQCVMCKSGICWATRGPRYGPGGVGDRSGGCGCTVEKRCHKDCRGCH